MRRVTRLAWAGALLVGSWAALAQPGSPREQAREAGEQAQELPAAPEAPAERPITFSFRVGGDLGFDAGVDTGGDLTATRARVGATVNIPAGQRGLVSIGYDYELSNYDFTGATGVIPGTSDPWGTIHAHGLSATYARRASLRWSWLVGGNLAWSAEEGADLGEGFTGGGFGAAQFAVTEKLIIGVGVGARSRLDDSAMVYPVILMDWSFAEKWKLSNEGRPGLTLSYVPNEQWSLDVTGGYEFRDFRLDDSGPLPGGVGTDSRLPLSVGVTWTPRPMFTFSARVGVHLLTEIEAKDSAGNTVGESDVDPAPFLGLEGRVRF
jgi:hypothetical protein